jgi:hypothetical protein
MNCSLQDRKYTAVGNCFNRFGVAELLAAGEASIESAHLNYMGYYVTCEK